MKARMTIRFGLVLILIGLGMFLASGPTAPTVLIPAVIGGFLLLTGVGMLTPYEHLYSRALLGATITAVMGLLGSIVALTSIGEFTEPAVLLSKVALAILSGGLLLIYAITIGRSNYRLNHPS